MRLVRYGDETGKTGMRLARYGDETGKDRDETSEVWG